MNIVLDAMVGFKTSSRDSFIKFPVFNLSLKVKEVVLLLPLCVQ